ncbi:DinB family protein [Paenibacillus filicis]|uniref:DinB family protein n=1 Tax=Paenibacillus filicis TaxID=669464 RepID=A0ABU9DNT3_9BACL
MKAYIFQQYEYHVWANHKLCAHLQELSEKVYRQELTSVFPTIYEAMAHVYVVDYNWLSFLEKGGVTDMSASYLEELKEETDRLVASTAGKRIEELDQMMTDLSERFMVYLVHHDHLEALCPSGAFQARYLDFVQHLVNHGTYHRGNVTAMLRQVGHAGTPTDFGFYLYTLTQA